VGGGDGWGVGGGCGKLSRVGLEKKKREDNRGVPVTCTPCSDKGTTGNKRTLRGSG